MNGIITDVCNVDDSALKKLRGKNRKSDNGEMKHLIFGLFEVRKEGPSQQQLSAVSPLLVAVHLL